MSHVHTEIIDLTPELARQYLAGQAAPARDGSPASWAKIPEPR